MPDYTEIGFDNFILRPVEVPSFQIDPIAVDQFLFQQEVPSSKVVGGKLVSSNGGLIIDLENGIIELNSDVGKMIVRDVNGVELLKIAESKLEIKSSNDKVLLDQSGLVGENNFKFNSVSSSINARILTTTATFFVDIPATSFNFSVERDSIVLIVGFLDLGSEDEGDTAVGRALILLNLDNQLYPNLDVWHVSTKDKGVIGFWYRDIVDASSAYTEHRNPFTFVKILKVKAGTHTGKLQWRQVGTVNMNINCYYSEVGYLVLGN